MSEKCLKYAGSSDLVELLLPEEDPSYKEPHGCTNDALCHEVSVGALSGPVEGEVVIEYVGEGVEEDWVVTSPVKGSPAPQLEVVHNEVEDSQQPVTTA